MGFFDRVKEIISNNKIIFGTVGVAAAAAVSYFIYLAATDDKFLEDPPEFTKQTSHQERQIIQLKNSFDKNDPAQIGKLFQVLQNGLEQITKKTQDQSKSRRREAKKKGAKEYFLAIAEGIQGLGEIVSEIQNKLFDQIGITEQEFEILCDKHQNVINEIMMNKMRGDEGEGEILSLQEMKNIIKIQRNYLTNPQLVKDIQQATREFPPEALNQIPIWISVMLGDCVEEKVRFDEAVFQRSINVHANSLMKDLQEQQMLLQSVMTKVMSGHQGFGNFGGMNPQDLMNGNPADIAALLGMQPQDVSNDKVMQGDNEMLMKMMQSMAGARN